MKRTVFLLASAVFAFAAAACLMTPEQAITRDNIYDPLNPDNIRSISLTVSGEEAGESLLCSATEASDGTPATLTATLNSDEYRMVSLSIDGAALSDELIIANGGTSSFTLSGSDVTVSAVFSDRNIEKILHASDKDESDWFGDSVSISGEYAIVGAREAEAAYIYKRDGSGSWNEADILHASDSEDYDNFGRSVGISGDYAIVGAYWAEGGSGESMAGAAYIFKNDGSDNWMQVGAPLKSDDLQAGDWFGWSVSISGDYAAVGAYNEDGGTDDPVEDAGAVYIFKRDDGADTWSQSGEPLHASDMAVNDLFGKSVCISGNYIIIGADYENGGSETPVTDAGAAYIFKNDGNDNWNEVCILHASDKQVSDYFGKSVGISGDYAVVGANGEDGGVGVSVSLAGAAYIFKNDGSDNWEEVEILHASDKQSSDEFGCSAAISGDYAVIGAYKEDGGDDGITDAGAVYVFKNDGSDNWKEVKILYASDKQSEDYFGSSAAIDGSYAVFGAYNEDGGSGDPASNAGAAYIINKLIY